MVQGVALADTGFWHRRLLDGITALSEATFPVNDIGAPDWKSTDMVRRTLEYISELPPGQRRLISTLYVFVELGALLLVFGLRRFSKIPAARRTEIIRGWRRSDWALLRMLGDSIKAVTTMVYMSHPSVMKHVAEYRACPRPLDPVVIDTHPDVFERPEHTT